MQITRRLEFDAGHRIPNHKGQCRHLHGHRYVIEITLSGDVIHGADNAADGMLMDFSDIKRTFKPILERLDHYYLNEIPGLDNPTSENIARWIWSETKPLLPALSAVELRETCTSGCIYRGD